MRGQFTAAFGFSVYKNYDPRTKVIKWTPCAVRGAGRKPERSNGSFWPVAHPQPAWLPSEVCRHGPYRNLGIRLWRCDRPFRAGRL